MNCTILSDSDRERMAAERREMQQEEGCSDRERRGLEADIKKLESGIAVIFNDVAEKVEYL